MPYTGVQLYLLWLTYFYLAAALRETVLMVNGSNIKGWWIKHHCWSAGCALLMLGLSVYSQGAGVGEGGRGAWQGAAVRGGKCTGGMHS